MRNWIGVGDRVGLAWERMPLGTVLEVDWTKDEATIKLDAPLPTSRTGTSIRKLSDLTVLGSAVRDRQGVRRCDRTSVEGRRLNGEELNPYADMIAQIDEALGRGNEQRSENFFRKVKGGIPQ